MGMAGARISAPATKAFQPFLLNYLLTLCSATNSHAPVSVVACLM